MTETEIRKLLSSDCKIVKDKTFGDWVGFKNPTAYKYDVVIVCLNDGSGLRPKRLYLPHQVYVEDLAKLCEGESVRQITLIPARSSEYVKVTEWK